MSLDSDSHLSSGTFRTRPAAVFITAALNAKIIGYQQLVEMLLYTLRSTTMFVPAAVYGVSVPDTSLYAHSLLSAALASTGGEFVLVALDVGKIQDYMPRCKSERIEPPKFYIERAT
ncbi:MAG: hypothetical protein LM577_05095 [Thermoproteaceae archaeon]|nr:hypothetical protein [Thermoproteaceae archaeon]